MNSEKRLEAIMGISAIISGYILIMLEKLIIVDSGIIRVSNSITREAYANDTFTPAALIVVTVSAICAVFWYFIASKKSIRFAPKDTGSARFTWVVLSFVAIASLIGVWVSPYGNNSSIARVLPWFLAFLSLDMVVTYWLSTAWSVPDRMLETVPLAFLVRWWQ